MMRKIYMKNGFTALVDDDDFGKINNYRWHPKMKNKGNVYANGRIKTPKGYKMCLLHRLISKAKANEVVEFKNGNSLDCRKSNLKLISRSLHHRRNRKAKSLNGKKCSSIFKGVYLDKVSKKWKANIGINGKMKYLGAFCDEIEAAIAYNNAATKIAGEYAYVNAPSFSKNSHLCNSTEEEIDKKSGTIPMAIGDKLLKELIYNFEELQRKNIEYTSDEIKMFNTVTKKLLTKNLAFNINEIKCIFRTFPEFNNEYLLLNGQLEKEVVDFIHSNGYSKLFYERH